MKQLYDKKKVEGMPQIELRVRGKGANGDGDFVAAFRSLPVALMKPPPEIVQWGSRFFIYRHTQKKGNLIYVEGFMFPLLEGMTCEEVDESEGEG